VDREAKIRILTVAALILLGAAGNYVKFSVPPAAGSLGVEGYRLGEAEFRVEPIEERFLDLLGAREVSFRTYDADDGDAVWVFLGYFDRQKEGSQVHSPKHCYPGSGWDIVAEADVPSPWGEGRVKRLTVSDGASERLVYYWFQTDDRVLNDVFTLKYHLTRQALLRHPQDVVFARVSTRVVSGTETAEELLKDYSQRLERAIGELYDARSERGNR
jgi:EpsI family protein